jgi:hypothetical protein
MPKVTPAEAHLGWHTSNCLSGTSSVSPVSGNTDKCTRVPLYEWPKVYIMWRHARSCLLRGDAVSEHDESYSCYGMSLHDMLWYYFV